MSVSTTYLQNRKKLLELRAAAIDGAGTILAKSAAESRAMTGEEQTEWEKRMGESDQFLKTIETMEKQEKVENALRDPVIGNKRAGLEDTAIVPDAKKNEAAELVRYRAWLRGGIASMNDEQNEEYRMAVQAMPAELRALSTLSTAAGGALVPTTMGPEIETFMKYFGGITEAARYYNTAGGETLNWPTEDDTANTGEQTTQAEAVGTANDPTYGTVVFSAYMIDTGILKVSLQLMQDSAFPLDSHLNELLGTRMGRKLNQLATTGAGSTTLQGVVVGASAGITNFPAASVSYANLIDLEYSVDRAYRSYTNPKCGFMMHDSTFKVIRKLSDDSSNPIFRRGTILEGLATNREPDTLNGYPVWINNDMATMAAAAKSILFGDFSKYVIRRVGQLVLFRFNELYMPNLQIGFLGFQRYDGHVINTNAIKYLTNGAS
jgi:HK97 family phage major capsid protein